MGWSGRKVAAFVLIGLCAAGTVAVWQARAEIPSPEDMALYLGRFGYWAPMVVIGLMILHSFVPFPAELLALCAGAVFGTLLGTAVIWIGAMIGAFVAFFLARWLGRELVLSWLPEGQAGRVDGWTRDRGALALLLCRFIPVIAFNLINYAAGFTRVRVWTFGWTTGVGILPVTVLCAYLGAQMKTLEWATLLGLSVVCIAIVMLVHVLIRRLGWTGGW
ncbi:TVP38/TMEM64 family protein [Rhodobacteraceae bacterium M382]|nr:TVP38/TMEM64 family protein [Rhodobacteraceae bacterium M382]